MPTESAIKQYSFFLFLLFLVTMGCWIGWEQKSMIQTILGICLLFTAHTKGIKFEFALKNILLCLVFYFSYLIVSLGLTVRVVISQLMPFLIPTFCIIFLSDQLKGEVLQRITKWFAYLMVISIVLYILSYVIGHSPFGTIHYDNALNGTYENFIFYIRPISYIGNFPRFSGPFIEPGHLGMMCSFLLFANNFDFKKKENVIIATTLIITLSLAGYVLAFIGFFFNRYYQGKTKIQNLLLYILLVGGFYYVGTFYNDGDNIINEKILSRLEIDDEKGISGNNRTNLFVMGLYAEMFTDTNLLLNGYGEDYLETLEEQIGHSTGYVYFMVRHGLIHLLITFTFYLLVLYTSKDRKYAFLFLVFIILCFLQRTYPFWMSWIICYEYAVRTKDNEKELICQN